jgi:hypothetical protein
MPSRHTPRLAQRSKLHPWLILAASAATGLANAQPTPAPTPAAPPTVVQMPPSETAPAPDKAAKPSATAPAATPPAADRDAAAAPPAPPVVKAPAAPVRRTRYDVAVLEALDKVTAESLRFEAPVGRPVRFKSLVFTVKACERSTPEEPVEDAIAYLTIDSQPRPEAGKPPLAPKQAFKGWMFASSPSLHALEHPVYAAWLITCRAAVPLNPPAAAPAAPVARASTVAPARTPPPAAAPPAPPR